jgi:hypothetical protein
MSRTTVALLAAALAGGAAREANAQKVELVYTKAALEQALDYKAKLKVPAAATNALSLFNVSPERAKAYLGTTAGLTAVIVFGDAALKAVSALEYTVPVIVIGATGTLAAKGPVIQVLDAGAGTGTAVTAASASASGSAPGKVIALKCAEAETVAVVGKLVADLAK